MLAVLLGDALPETVTDTTLSYGSRKIVHSPLSSEDIRALASSTKSNQAVSNPSDPNVAELECSDEYLSVQHGRAAGSVYKYLKSCH